MRRATKLIPGLYDKPYNDRLAAIKVPCMSYRRMQGDMILVYKILCGDNQSLCNLFTINEPRTRGHNCKLYFKPLIQTKIRKHFFSINIFYYKQLGQSSLEVANAVSLDSLKSKLDNAWEDKINVF